jgi:hypothetical protein
MRRLLLAEGIGSLLLVVLGHRRPQDAPWMVAGWIGARFHRCSDRRSFAGAGHRPLSVFGPAS